MVQLYSSYVEMGGYDDSAASYNIVPTRHSHSHILVLINDMFNCNSVFWAKVGIDLQL